uniref:procollagen-proline 4-dioxygenase n=1 Tax=Pyramimonas obovata TaxID=1411642 RepID=A0A7S0QZW0_9CHLO|mmetsp:Transcript_23052/g.50544  ORF Transcript_23052/g.50544 Transcript_23052/m.50544 type:complete len:273 (+) Transcript_23052:140-958(+)|eukprot:CAMPEP_0118933620 /NCGR_PEP_ID=MMETSP1169-20130426/12093_1 /TAXON_ID=36882 /ORGANISM="Pyramimonas obovata, Strain CCMP722" /LENGTH=272 /DNA_ID=CAMNT_0006876403 /DNA_START=140 /DNA_END=958 /DNA_ORIENTATION=+
MCAGALPLRVLLLSFLAPLISAAEEKLIGWKGETYQGPKLRGNDVFKERDEQVWVETIAWEPRAFIAHNFLSKEECLQMIHLGAPHMVKSSVIDSKTGRSVDSKIRTSYGMFLPRGKDEFTKKIEERIAAFAMVPIDHGEGIQILHYEAGQKYEAHYDYFHDQFNVVNGGQRIATVLMYLSDVEEGGETGFPIGKPIPSYRAAQEREGSLSPCAQKGAAVKPRRGDALLFYSLKTDGNTDPASLHAGCPVIRGDKWSATKWMRVNEFKVTMN